jgi:hypothetical protein
MGKFTTFDAPIGTKGPISVQKVTAKDFGGDAGFGTIGEALKGAADDVEKRQIIQKRIQVKKENADINQANIDNQGFGASLFRDAAKNADANATDFTTNVLAEYDRNAEGRLALAPNDRVRAAMKLDFSRTRNLLVDKAALFESTTRGKNERKVFLDNSATAANVLYETPTDDQFDLIMNGRAREISNTSLPEHIKEDLLRDEVKSLRFKQYAGKLEYAVTAEQVDQILGDRPEDELTATSFTQLGKAGEAKKKRFEYDTRLARMEQNGFVRDAQAAIRGVAVRQTRGQLPDEASKANVERLVQQANDPDTSEMWFNATTVGRSINTWQKLPSAELETIVAELKKDVDEAGTTALESSLHAAAKSVLGTTLASERKTQAEIDNTVTTAFETFNHRLAANEDISQDKNVLMVLANLKDVSPKVQQRIREAFAQNEAAQGLMDSSLAELGEQVEAAALVRRESDMNMVAWETSVKVLATMSKMTKKNYQDYQQLAAPEQHIPLNGDDPEAMKAREASMLAGATKYGKADQFHTTGEIAAIGERLPDMTSSDQLKFIAGYTQHLTPENAVTALAELGEANPLVAYVGAGIASDLSFRDTGALILRGSQILAHEKGIGIPAELTTTVGDMKIAIATSVVGALNNELLPPHHRAAVQSAALALIATRAATDAKTAVNMALGGDGVLGGIQPFNGENFAAPVGVSGGMIEDAFEDNPKTLTALSVGGHPPVTVNNVPVSAAAIVEGGTLERIGPDMFAVRMQSDKKLLRGAPDKLYALHITQERMAILGILPPPPEIEFDIGGGA